MKVEEKIDKILTILSMIVGATNQEYYSDHLTGLTHKEWKECINIIYEMRGIDKLE